MNSTFSICGLARLGGDGLRNMVVNPGNFSDKNVKEIIYSTELGDVESLFGFSDLDIVEVDDDSKIAQSARVFLDDNDFVQAVVFLSNGFLVINDLTFFSAYTRIDGKDVPYTSLVESDTYEDDIAVNMIEEDIRLQ